MLLPFRGVVKRPYSRMDVRVGAGSLGFTVEFRPVAEAATEAEAVESTPAPLSRSFDLEDLRRRPWWKDCNVAALGLNGAVWPVRAECLEARQSELTHVSLTHANAAALLYVPDTEALFTDMAIMPLLDADTILAADAPVDDELRPGERARDKIAPVMPRLRLRGPKVVPPDGRAVCFVEALLNGEPYPGLLDVHLECVNGFLPRTRLRVADEAVSFPVLSTGLEPGDSIKIKAGFRFMVAQAEYVIRVEEES